MIYEIEFARKAQKELRKLPETTRLRISKSIHKLANNPRTGAVRPMVGSKSWRLRVGDYRVVYDIHDEKLFILIIRVKHRRETYRNK